MLSKGTKKRLSRIRRRAIPEVLEAFEAGKISARRADTLLYLQPDEQRAQLNALLAEQALIARRSRMLQKSSEDMSTADNAIWQRPGGFANSSLLAPENMSKVPYHLANYLSPTTSIVTLRAFSKRSFLQTNTNG